MCIFAVYYSRHTNRSCINAHIPPSKVFMYEIYQTLVIILIPSVCISTTRISYKSTLLVGKNALR